MSLFPDIKRFDRLSLDTETTGLGYSNRPVGMSVSLPDGTDRYLRWGHEMGGNNCTKDEALTWLRKEVNRDSLTVYMHNAGFDLRMLAYELGHEHPFPFARVEDTGFMAALLNDLESSMELDSLGEKYVGMPKQGDLLWEFCSTAFGGAATRDSQAKNIWRAPGDVVEKYAGCDSRITLALADYFKPRIAEEDLTRVYEMETGLIPILLKMHMTGVRVDVDRAQAMKVELQKQELTAHKEWADEYGNVNFGSTAQVAQLFDRLGIPYRRTEKGNPSITKDDLEFMEHPVAKQITRLKKLKHFRGTFIDNYILGNVDDNGIIHGEFHPLRNERYGARSGRFSSGGGLNLQNIPSRDEELAPLVRGLFIPMRSDQMWVKADYSQIEYRFLAHYAGGELMDAYNNDPTVNFHQMCSDLVGIPYKPAKNINFGIVYGMGKKLMATKLGLSMKEADDILSEYHQRLPMVKKLYKQADRRASNRGYITTWGSRKRRFERDGRYHKHTHKALNALLQGSAADLLKMAMLRVADTLDWEETPMHLTVHDELDFSMPKNKRARNKFTDNLREQMEDFDLRVPVKVDIEQGPDWGHVEEAA